MLVVDLFHVPPLLSLVVILAILGTTIVLSLRIPAPGQPADARTQ